MNTVVVKSIDSGRVKLSVDEYAQRLLRDHPEIDEIVVFGSFADGTYSPGSDLDVFILLRSSLHSIRDRIPLYMPDTFPVPLDLFPFTHEEVEEREDSPLLKAVRRSDWRYRREETA